MAKITLSAKQFCLTAFSLLMAGFSFAQTQTFSADGTFTVPIGVTSITIEAWGAGGRGATIANQTTRGGGGGGGAYARKTLTVSPGNVFTVQVGLGATGTAAGEDSWFGDAATVLAKGGNSAGNNSSTGASGGAASASIGDFVLSGGNGANGSTAAGGGGSSAGRFAAGVTATGSTGATAPSGGGNGGAGRTSSAGNGTAGSVPGGGGGGAFGSSTSTRTGGSGAAGRVIVRWNLPEINMAGNGNNIADGSASTSTSNNTDFGVTSVTSGTITRTFVISNTGFSNLTISSIAFSGTHAADFSVTTSPAATIAPGGTSSFVVTFNPSASGVRNATITINNNDFDEGAFEFAIAGTGATPDIEVRGNNVVIADDDNTPVSADFTTYGSIAVTGGSLTRTYTITSPASASIALTLGTITLTGTNASQFSVTQPSVTTLNPGESTTFTVTFDPSTTGTKNAVVNIANDSATKNPYNFSIQGVGKNPEINVISNFVNINSGDTTPSVSDGTDFGTVSIEAGLTVNTFTIRNTGVGPLSISSVMITGPDALNFVLNTNPAANVAEGASTSFMLSFNPNTLGVKNATIYIYSDDSDENPFTFAITGLGVRTFLDTDGDGVTDNIDIDDDNDGIIDTMEQSHCASLPLSGTYEHTFLNETFGAGPTRSYINVNVPNATCNYCFEDGVIQPNTAACPSQSSGRLDDGEYTVVHKIASSDPADPENIHLSGAWNGPEDHTPGDVQGRMAVFNASFAPGTFYETAISGVLPNVPITYSFWVLNIMSQHNYVGSILPNITVEFLDMSNNVLSTYNTGDIGRCNGGVGANGCVLSEWQQYSTNVNLGNNTQFVIRFKNNAPGGGGNDLAIDDIVIKQEYCDRDSDGVANMFDLDADNDGIPDIEEAGFKSLTAGRAVMDMLPSVWADANGNGLHDDIDAMIAGGTYMMPDFDGDSVPDFIDLDSDNDSQFDVDEAGLINGDGDIDGDGIGDGPDTDRDGVLDIFENVNGWGTQVRPFAEDIDGDGQPDQLDLDYDGNGTTDISDSLYSSLDANNDGIIDGSADADKDGIIDAFDTAAGALGSPRDLDRKLFLEFDGRNDYAESRQLLSGLPQASIMGWIKISPAFFTQGFVLGQDNFNIRVTSTGGRRLVATANGAAVTYNVQLQPNRWYHVAAVYNGGASSEKMKLFLNGQQVITSNNAALAGTLASSTANFSMGKNPTASNLYFMGSIEEVRVFNTALTNDQLQKMVYQEIKQNGTAVRGEVIPKDIEASTWASLLAYYRMDVYKDDVIDDYTTSSLDEGASTSFARIYNVKNIKYQLAPMPFETTIVSTLDDAVSQNNFVNGMDVFTYDWSIVRINHDIKLPFNQNSLGLFIGAGVDVTLNNDNAIKNSWYLKLDGTLDLEGRSQLVQGPNSDLDPNSIGKIERDQQGQTNKFNYNYWSSPVSPVNPTTNNNPYTVASVMKDGTNALNWQDIQWTSGLNGSPTSPITLSSYWIFKFQNVSNSYSNWSTVGPNGTLLPGQGYTLKGSNAATPSQNYVFVGKPFNGTISNPIAAGNMNLSGNPYASAIDADQFIADNLSSTTGTLYFWEHFSTNNSHVLLNYQGGYATRTLVGGTPPIAPAMISNQGSSTRLPGRFIPVGQAFFVVGNTVGGNVTFNNGQRAFIREDNFDSNVMFRTNNMLATTASDDILNNNEDEVVYNEYTKIRLGYNSPDNYHRQVLLGFMEEHATAGLDAGYDALHIDGQPSDMYFMLGSKKLNIQGDGYFNENNIYPLGVKAVTAGNIQFVIDGLENLDSSQEIYIYDNQTQVYHDIRNNPATFEVPAGATEDRFSLRFKATEGSLSVENPALADNIWIAYASNEALLNIKNNLMEVTVKDVLLINMLGQQVGKEKVENQPQQNIMIPVKSLAAGTYIVKLMTTAGEISKKIVIK